jgi:hypothetical protein
MNKSILFKNKIWGSVNGRRDRLTKEDLRLRS